MDRVLYIGERGSGKTTHLVRWILAQTGRVSFVSGYPGLGLQSIADILREWEFYFETRPNKIVTSSQTIEQVCSHRILEYGDDLQLAVDGVEHCPGLIYPHIKGSMCLTASLYHHVHLSSVIKQLPHDVEVVYLSTYANPAHTEDDKKRMTDYLDGLFT